MNSDCFFALGSTHVVCQDYALADEQGAVYLSDGCSGSPATDFGSRFLTRAARLQGFPSQLFYEPTLRDSTWARHVIERARQMAESAVLQESCLDATLAVILTGDEAFRPILWGDGVVAARRRSDGGIVHVVVECPKGAPDYLSYLLDEYRQEVYLAETGGQKTATYFRDGKPMEPVSIPCFTPCRWAFFRDHYDMVAVFSDGVRSFLRPEGTSLVPVPEYEVLQHVMAVKSTTGAFVVRRARNGFLHRHCVSEKWVHTDDFAMAAIHWEAP
jgi:hypothetical protein